MTEKVITCPICLQQVANWESHHIWPVALGGPVDGRQINLCSTCHHYCHLTAKAILKKNGMTNETQYFTDVNELQRAKPIIDVIVKATLQYEGQQSNQRRRRIYILQVSDVTHTRLHKLQRDMGYGNLQDFLSDLFENITNGKIDLHKR